MSISRDEIDNSLVQTRDISEKNDSFFGMIYNNALSILCDILIKNINIFDILHGIKNTIKNK